MRRSYAANAVNRPVLSSRRGNAVISPTARSIISVVRRHDPGELAAGLRLDVGDELDTHVAVIAKHLPPAGEERSPHLLLIDARERDDSPPDMARGGVDDLSLEG